MGGAGFKTVSPILRRKQKFFIEQHPQALNGATVRNRDTVAPKDFRIQRNIIIFATSIFEL